MDSRERIATQNAVEIVNRVLYRSHRERKRDLLLPLLLPVKVIAERITIEVDEIQTSTA